MLHMSQTALNLAAISVFVLVLSSLLGPLFNLSPVVPAITVFSLLAIATLDNFSLQGQGGTLLIDWLASASPQHRERIVRHEAGHFLVAALLDVPVHWAMPSAPGKLSNKGNQHRAALALMIKNWCLS